MLTPEQREARRKCVGASDFPILLGCDLYGRTIQQWAMEKRYGTYDEPTADMALGNTFEPSLVNYAAQELGEGISVGDTFRREFSGFLLGVNLDARLALSRRPVEGKLVMSSATAQAFGEAGTDQVPMAVVAQTIPQMLVCEVNEAVVSALVIGRRPALYYVKWDAGLWDMMKDRAAECWRRYVVLGEQAPDAAETPIEFYRKLNREPGKTVLADAMQMVVYGAARARRLDKERDLKAAETFEKQALSQLLSRAGDADTIESPVGTIKIKRTPRKAYTVAATEQTRITFAPKELTYGGTGNGVGEDQSNALGGPVQGSALPSGDTAPNAGEGGERSAHCDQQDA